ncbi:MAG: DUF4302 domain-containing protein [Draconibacterium sp.]
MKNIHLRIVKITILLFCGVGILNSCNDDSFSPFPDDRLTAEEHEQNIADLLVSAENGWKLVLKPNLDATGGYNMVVKFSTNGTCEMAGDYYEYNAAYGTVAYDASKKQTGVKYAVKHVSNFELSFETYCFIHKLYELGYNNTFQYRIESYTDDEIVIADGDSKMVMTRATANDWNMKPYMVSELKFKEYLNNTVLFNYLHGGNDPQIQLAISFSKRSIGFYYFEENGELVSQEIGYYFSTDGMVLKRPLEIPGMEPINSITFGDLTDGEGITKVLNVTLNGGHPSSFYSSVRSMVPVDDGIDHFLKVNGISVASGGRFWSSRKSFEGGFQYGDSLTYFGLEDQPYFSEFSIYLGYYNAKLNNTYNFFSFVYYAQGYEAFYDVYFTYETSGSDQIVFSLDTQKGYGGYSTFIPEEIKVEIEPMINKLIQPEGYTLVSTPEVNAIDGSLSMYLVDNKLPGFMYMRTGTLH